MLTLHHPEKRAHIPVFGQGADNIVSHTHFEKQREARK
jgi:hypothetical protein